MKASLDKPLVDIKRKHKRYLHGINHQNDYGRLLLLRILNNKVLSDLKHTHNFFTQLLITACVVFQADATYFQWFKILYLIPTMLRFKKKNLIHSVNNTYCRLILTLFSLKLSRPCIIVTR